MFRSKASAVAVASLLLVLTGCGPDDANPGGNSTTPTTSAATSTGAPSTAKSSPPAAQGVEFEGTLPKPCTLVSKDFAQQVMGGDIEFSTIDGNTAENDGVRARICTYFQNTTNRVEVNITTFTYPDIETAWIDPFDGVNIVGEPIPAKSKQIGDETVAAIFNGSDNMGVVAFRRGDVAVKVVVKNPRKGGSSSQSVEQAFDIAKKAAEAKF